MMIMKHSIIRSRSSQELLKISMEDIFLVQVIVDGTVKCAALVDGASSRK